MKCFFFALLVFAFCKEPNEVTDFNCLHLKNNFDFFKLLKMYDSSDETL